MFKQFDSVDPECDHHWDEKVYSLTKLNRVLSMRKLKLQLFSF